MSERLSPRILIIGLGVLGLAIAAIVFLGSARSDAAPTQGSASPSTDTSNQFSVLSPIGPGASSAAQGAPSSDGAAASDAALSAVTGAVLPGNSQPQQVSALGVASMPNGNQMTVAALGQSLCVMHGADAACGDTPGVVSGKLFGARPDGCRHYWVFGLVPDGVSEIQIDSGNDGVIDQTLPVVDNVYEGDLTAVPTTAIGLDSSGASQFRTELPLGFYAENEGPCTSAG